jgi:hypothetical protein
MLLEITSIEIFLESVLPLLFEHVKTNLKVPEVLSVISLEPLVLTDPCHSSKSPEALHDVVFEDDQLSVIESFVFADERFDEKEFIIGNDALGVLSEEDPPPPPPPHDEIINVRDTKVKILNFIFCIL